jgi:hypothetical protein
MLQTYSVPLSPHGEANGVTLFIDWPLSGENEETSTRRAGGTASSRTGLGELDPFDTQGEN